MRNVTGQNLDCRIFKLAKILFDPVAATKAMDMAAREISKIFLHSRLLRSQMGNKSNFDVLDICSPDFD